MNTGVKNIEPTKTIPPNNQITLTKLNPSSISSIIPNIKLIKEKIQKLIKPFLIALFNDLSILFISQFFNS